MQFIYPAILHKTETGYEGYFPDLEGAPFSGETIDEAVENAHHTCETWILVELDEDVPFLPPVTDTEDLSLQEGEFIRLIHVTIRLLDGWDE